MPTESATSTSSAAWPSPVPSRSVIRSLSRAGRSPWSWPISRPIKPVVSRSMYDRMATSGRAMPRMRSAGPSCTESASDHHRQPWSATRSPTASPMAGSRPGSASASYHAAPAASAWNAERATPSESPSSGASTSTARATRLAGPSVASRLSGGSDPHAAATTASTASAAARSPPTRWRMVRAGAPSSLPFTSYVATVSRTSLRLSPSLLLPPPTSFPRTRGSIGFRSSAMSAPRTCFASSTDTPSDSGIASGAPGSRNTSSAQSCHRGFDWRTRSGFHSRRHFLSCFSRRIASWIPS